MNAQQSNMTKKLGISGDEMNSLYIIGGVLVFGIGVYVIYSIIDRNRKEDKPANRRPVSHRNHHHHRVVKKSA
jgi:ABC-type nickel/cobalt efflux system permease component RcnA